MVHSFRYLHTLIRDELVNNNKVTDKSIMHECILYTGLTSLCGRPAAEKMGIFCPLAMLFIVSMADIPVWIISSG